MKTALDQQTQPKPKKQEEPIDHDSHAEERALMAEMRNVQARPKTMLGSAYRGRK